MEVLKGGSRTSSETPTGIKRRGKWKKTIITRNSLKLSDVTYNESYN